MKIYFKCILKSDIIINASLATEGNMKTLDYIPGSNFLGIVAKDYDDWKKRGLAYALFHSGEVSFGDAHLARDGKPSYAMPYSLYTNKLDTEVRGENTKVWLHHALVSNEIRPKDEEDNFIQLKQHRSGYFNKNGDFIPRVKKQFALKSAQDRTTRKSRDSAMFGFESMSAGQEFIFSVDFKKGNPETEKIIGTIKQDLIDALSGSQKIGKSKSAQYGQVNIEKIEDPDTFADGNFDKHRLLIYAESNLCFFNEYGQPTYQPSPKDFGLEDKGQFDWSASQVRTYSYSPWNTHRKTTDPQRDCIQKGSVLVFNLVEGSLRENPLLNHVGSFNSEGLGRVIYNPEFLTADEQALWNFKLIKPDPKSSNQQKTTDTEESNYGTLGKFLLRKYTQAEKELAIGKAVQKFIMGKTDKDKTHKSLFAHISTSQWGGIRSEATKSTNNRDLITSLFGEKGVLNVGVAADRYWNKKGGLARETLKGVITNNALGKDFVVKLAAEMAKWKQQHDKSLTRKPLTHE